MLSPGSSRITDQLPVAGASFAARDLLERMMVESDNTAADLVLSLAGGPDGVSLALLRQGLGQIDVSRTEAARIAEQAGMGRPPSLAWSRARWNERLAAVPVALRRAALEDAALDRRDTATPDEMTSLLARLQRGDLLLPESAAYLLDLMTRSSTGGDRLKALLPPGTPVAHKTGSGVDFEGVNMATNDVGVITLPGSRGHLAISVFIKGSARDPATRHHAIARVARAAYDAWVR